MDGQGIIADTREVSRVPSSPRRLDLHLRCEKCSCCFVLGCFQSLKNVRWVQATTEGERGGRGGVFFLTTSYSVLSTPGLSCRAPSCGGSPEGQAQARSGGLQEAGRTWATCLEDPPSAGNGHSAGEIQLDGKALLPSIYLRKWKR